MTLSRNPPPAPDSLPSALTDAWAQDSGETDEQYEAFLTWLDAGADRRVPPPAWQPIANRFNWSERVMAYERATAVAMVPSGGLAEQIAANLEHVVAIESGKLLRQSASTVGATVSVAELVRVVALLGELRGAKPGGTGAREQAPDYSKLSTEELKTLYAAGAIVRRAKGEA